MEKRLTPARLSGTVAIPASKSHTIRALLIAALAEGRSVIRNPLHSADARACVEACRQFGAEVDTSGPDWVVTGLGGRFTAAENVVDTQNSGTTLYLAMSLAALGTGWTFFTGDHQIRRRSADNLLTALRGLGAQAFSAKDNGCAPLAVRGPWTGGRISISCPTSQFLSSLLLAAPLAPAGVKTEIDVPLLNEVPYAEMTLAWMDSQNIRYERRGIEYFQIPGGQAYRAFDRPVAADWSSATFFVVAAAVSGGPVTLTGLDVNDVQGDKKVLDFVRALGAEVTVTPTAQGTDITVKAPRLVGCELDLNDTPDALPAFAVLGCFAEGTTVLKNVAHARLKETDRIAVMAAELGKMGADIEERPDGLVIRRSRLKGARVQGHHDHRVVMSLALAACGAEGETVIDTAEAVDVTFPTFFPLLEQLRAL